MGLKILVDRAADWLVGLGLASLKDTGMLPRDSGYGRPLGLAAAGAWWSLGYRKRPTPRDTPLCPGLSGRDQGWSESNPVDEMRRNLEALRLSAAPGLIDSGDRLVVPIRLPVGVEQDAVLEDVVGPLGWIARLVGAA